MERRKGCFVEFENPLVEKHVDGLGAGAVHDELRAGLAQSFGGGIEQRPGLRRDPQIDDGVTARLTHHALSTGCFHS